MNGISLSIFVWDFHRRHVNLVLKQRVTAWLEWLKLEKLHYTGAWAIHFPAHSKAVLTQVKTCRLKIEIGQLLIVFNFIEIDSWGNCSWIYSLSSFLLKELLLNLLTFFLLIGSNLEWFSLTQTDFSFRLTRTLCLTILYSTWCLIRPSAYPWSKIPLRSSQSCHWPHNGSLYYSNLMNEAAFASLQAVMHRVCHLELP